MCFVSRNPTVTAMQSTMSSQLISGMYIWPWILSDVCTTFTLGKQLKERLWLIMENVPLMIAWLPTTDAKIANTSTGHLTLSAFQSRDHKKDARMVYISETLNLPKVHRRMAM